MKPEFPAHDAPEDAQSRRQIAPVICYPVDALPPPDLPALHKVRDGWEQISETLVPPRDARCFDVPAGHFCRIVSIEGPQVGDLNLWSADLSERFFSSKTRALHGTHLSTGDRLWSSFPTLRPMATITDDTLDWYGFDGDGLSVHDVIGSRCDPYTHNLLSDGGQYHHCCHSNLTRALAKARDLPLDRAEALVHDVLNVFMCTGFSRQSGQYLMKASPVRPGDYLEFFAEIDLLGALSACPGGDCGTLHSSDQAACHPLLVQVFRPVAAPEGWRAPDVNGYDRSHGGLQHR